MSSFFTLPASQKKRKRPDERNGKPTKRRVVEGDRLIERATRQGAPRKLKNLDKRQQRDVPISGSDSEGSGSIEVTDSEGTSEEEENAADRRIRLAQQYLDNIREEVDEAGFDAADLDKDLISARLKEDADASRGRQYRLVANSLDLSHVKIKLFRGKQGCVTVVAACPPFVYTACKDKTVIKWRVPETSTGNTQMDDSKTGRQEKTTPQQEAYVRGIKIRASAPAQHGHTRAIVAMAASPDGRYVATGGVDRKLIIWSAEDLTPLKTFTSHRDSVVGLSFAPMSSHPGVGAQLFSASMDRTIKTFNLAGMDSLAYVETLFGHQDHVTGIASMSADQCVSVGARDRTARLWKVVDETQLVFRADSSKHESYPTGRVDCVAALPPAHFVTGSDSGALSLWSIHKKKPLFTVSNAHGADIPIPLCNVTSESDPRVVADLQKDDARRPTARAITALTTVPGTDVVLTGSWDGNIRLWKVSDDKRTLQEVGTLGAGGPSTNGHALRNGDAAVSGDSNSSQGIIKGVVNSIAVFERRKYIRNESGSTREGDSLGLCVVGGIAKETRLGDWQQWPHGRNGLVLYELQILQ